MKVIFLFFISFVFVSLNAQPGSEIYLADLKISKTGITLSNPQNITNRKGYDNQPFFHPDKPVIYFSSFDVEGRADIKTFNFKTRRTTQFTQTPEREYSPTITPDKNFISCIIQRDNGAQDLGKFPKDGGPASILIDNLTVGYHAWISPSAVAVFVLGEPNTLRVYDLVARRDTIVAQNIGRALHRIPKQGKISFVDKNADPWLIKTFQKGKIENIAPTLPARDDLAWTPDGKIIMSDGRQFFFYDTKQNGKWQMFFSSGLKGVTRIAVSADGKRIAFVVAEE
jgi:WD40-like Beta Propeller Repeat